MIIYKIDDLNLIKDERNESSIVTYQFNPMVSGHLKLEVW